jgi:alpha-L-arabinofuranosidase
MDVVISQYIFITELYRLCKNAYFSITILKHELFLTMKSKPQFILSLVALILSGSAFAAPENIYNEPDSVYLFSYSTGKNQNKNGLHFAWSPDRNKWFVIGNEYGYVKSDYGRWGDEKGMVAPYLIQDGNGMWQCVWGLNDRDMAFAHAGSKDLVDWGRQSYPVVKQGANFLRPVIHYDKQRKSFNITYIDKNSKYYRVSTKNFKVYTPAEPVSAKEYKNLSISLDLPTGKATGQLHRVPWSVVEKLVKTYEMKQYKNLLYNEYTKQDKVRFDGLKPVKATITVQQKKAKPISDLLLGVFFEDINYAADGGLYAELIQNRDFEYALSDREGKDKNWTSTHSWSLRGDNGTFAIDSTSPIHTNNPHYAVIDIKMPGAALVNSGFDGIAVRKGEQYKLSFFAKQLGGSGGPIVARLVNKDGDEVGTVEVAGPSNSWHQATATITASDDAADARLELQPTVAGRVALEMISLFPEKTFKDRKNGLRADLAQLVSDLRPRFMRFPGGCVAHGDGLKNIYRWKNTIGPLEARKPQRNLWGYHQTAGLGYFEYFQFCEDIGAEPLPVIAAGVPCQNSATGGGGQQGGIPLSEMDEYIQDILDLVEWANGDVNTTWGRKRAEAGHPQPFNLKYVGIGNEDLITDIFEERFTMIFKAIKKTHPEITVIGTVGPSSEGTDYEEGWEIAKKLQVPMVDEHYYQNPSWFIYNQDFYDRYDRSKSKVYLGEYAAHLPGRPNNLETALAEALYLTSLERNGDIVSMASYAPLLAKDRHTQWNPNLIYFNNTEVKPTVGYEVQKLYGTNAGDKYIPADITLTNNQEAVKKRIAYSIVQDTKTKDVIIKMVNMLPVSVDVAIDIKDLKLTGAKADKTVLHGDPEDKKLQPSISTIDLADKFESALMPYSFTVLRLRGE